jgi:hypothetical protein
LLLARHAQSIALLIGFANNTDNQIHTTDFPMTASIPGFVLVYQFISSELGLEAKQFHVAPFL